jgi:hypothetical protein
MNKRKREAWRKHRLSAKKTEEKRKAAATQTATAARSR